VQNLFLAQGKRKIWNERTMSNYGCRTNPFFVSMDGETLILLDLSCGVAQGSILGPILYAVYVSPFLTEPN
jgi:hypothetical protein